MKLAAAERKKHDVTPQADLHKVEDDTATNKDWLERADAEALGQAQGMVEQLSVELGVSLPVSRGRQRG